MASDRPAPDWLTRTTYAHRGLHSAGVPENSLAAAEAAMARGLGIECDIQRSRDGVAIVFHDWELERLTGTQGDLSALEAGAIEAVNLLGTSQKPVRLERFLEAIDGRVPLLIEIKSRPDYDIIPSCLQVARNLENYSGHVAVMSFDPRVPEWFAQSAPEITRGLVGTDSLPNGFEHVWREPTILEQAGPEFLAIDRRDLGQSEAKAWRSSGKPLLSWTIRTRSDWDEAIALADALIAEGEALA